MSNLPSKEVTPELLAALPEALREFIVRGESGVETDEDEWELEIERPKKYLAPYLPAGAVLIWHNGLGDHLFLVPSASSAAVLDIKVQLYRHDGPEISLLVENIATLVNPPAPTPTSRPPVYYHGGQTEVQLGDEVSARNFFVRRPGRVIYVPGISKRNRDMEHHGLCWVGISFFSGARLGTVVDPETSWLKKSVRFVQRSQSPFEEMSPRERFE